MADTATLSAKDTKIALLAAELCARNGLPTADAIVYATALDRGADLLTCDAHFEGLDHVTYVAKRLGGWSVKRLRRGRGRAFGCVCECADRPV